MWESMREIAGRGKDERGINRKGSREGERERFRFRE